MKKYLGHPHIFGLLSVAIIMARATACFACAAYGASDETRPVAIADEQVLLSWDESTHTEHFIREVTFDTDAAEMVFVVPTPSKPEVAEADDRIFSALAEIVKPRPIPVYGVTIRSIFGDSDLIPLATFDSVTENIGAGTEGETVVPATPAVKVLEQKTVASMEVQVLDAPSIEALTAWFKDHNYKVSQAGLRWMKGYVEKGWALTAFRYRGNKNAGGITAKAIRLSFHADTPFYPYHEPSDAPALQGRLLRLYLVSQSGLEPLTNEWNSEEKREFSIPARLSSYQRAKQIFNEDRYIQRFADLHADLRAVSEMLPAGALPQAAALQSFRDHSESRKFATDIEFGNIPAGMFEAAGEVVDDDRRFVIPIEGILLVIILLTVRWCRKLAVVFKRPSGEIISAVMSALLGMTKDAALIGLLCATLWATASLKLIGYAYLHLYSPQEGDIVIQSAPHSVITDKLEKATYSELSEAGIVIRRDGQWMVAESMPNVVETPLAAWVFRGRKGAFTVQRPDPHLLDDHALGLLKNYIAAEINGPASKADVNLDDKHSYCSEFVWKAFKTATGTELASFEQMGQTNGINLIQVYPRPKIVPQKDRTITPYQLAKSTQLSTVGCFGLIWR